MTQTCGNEQCVQLAERVLEEARQGRMGFLAVTFGVRPVRDDEPAIFKGTYRGDTSLEHGVEGALEALRRQWVAEKDNDSIPTVSGMTRDFVVYDAARGAMCYDFANWLIEMEMERIAAGAPAPLKVAFFHGRDGQSGFDEPGRRQILENVIRPMLSLVGAVEDERAIEGHTQKFYLPIGVTQKCRAGQAVPYFTAPRAKQVEVAQWLGSRKRPIVITLRQSTAWPHRNSNAEAWLKFGLELQERGHDVIFVRDTAHAYDPKPKGIVDCPRASVDVQFRMALYEWAGINFFTSNGPANLAIYSRVPYLLFIDVQEDGAEYEPDTPRFWRGKCGIEPGEQFPWAQQNQRIVWAPDSYENIMTAWESFAAPLAQAAE